MLSMLLINYYYFVKVKLYFYDKKDFLVKPYEIKSHLRMYIYRKTKCLTTFLENPQRLKISKQEIFIVLFYLFIQLKRLNFDLAIYEHISHITLYINKLFILYYFNYYLTITYYF